MLKKHLADLLGVSPGMVSRYLRAGMPQDPDAARHWRATNLSFGRRKEHRMLPIPRQAPRPAAPPAPDWAKLRELFELGHALLRDGKFALIEKQLRAALRTIHYAYRDEIAIEIEDDAEAGDDTAPLVIQAPVWAALIEDVRAVVEQEQATLIASGVDVSAPLSADDDEYMAMFWFCAAAGEVVAPL